MNLKAWLGVEGVHPDENPLAVKVGGYISYLVLFALLIVVVQLVIDLSEQQFTERQTTGVFVWTIFMSELLLCTLLVNDKWRYLRHNWLNVAIVILAFPWIDYGSEWAPLIRMLRLLLFIRVLNDVVWDVVRVLRQNNFGMVLLFALVFVVVAGAVFSMLENTDFATGLWYVLVSVTTVGYGDVVPHTNHGRIFGAVLIFFGVVLFSIVTANIAAFLIGSEQRKTEKDILHYVKLVKDHLEAQSEQNEQQFVQMYQKIESRLQLLEKQLETIRMEKNNAESDEADPMRLKEIESLKKQIHDLKNTME